MIPDIKERPDLEIVGYLRRYCLIPRNKEGNIYLHNIQGPDDPFFHDHPWAFTSYILNGGYVERVFGGLNHRLATRVRRNKGDTFRKRPEDMHYIESVEPDTWTLIITGPVVRDWGFRVNGNWIHHTEHKAGRQVDIIEALDYRDAERYPPSMYPSDETPRQLYKFQASVREWMLECFGRDITANRAERNHRFLEEALELVQSLDCTKEDAHRLVDYVFNRPVGDPPQEVGGTMVTLAALCNASGLRMGPAGLDELRRIQSPEVINKIRQKQKSKPPGPLPQ